MFILPFAFLYTTQKLSLPSCRITLLFPANVCPNFNTICLDVKSEDLPEMIIFTFFL